jgi:hypothetical protein
VSASCDDVRERAFLGRSTADDDAHLATCEACGFEAAALGSLATAFAAHRVAAPSPELETRVLGAAEPALAARRRHAGRRALAAAGAAALLPLPLILMIDLWAMQAIYDGLSRLLPATVSFYLVVNYAAVLALLGALTYGAIPLLAERQARGHREALHG